MLAVGITGPLWAVHGSKAILKTDTTLKTSTLHYYNYTSTIWSTSGGVYTIGPLLFLIYIDLLEIIPSSKVFADDSYKASQNYPLRRNRLQSVTNWCKKWNLSMNRSKCKVMRFYQPVLEETSGYHIDGTQIDFTDNYKDLGIQIHQTGPNTINIMLKNLRGSKPY